MADIKKPQPFPIKQPSPPNRPAGTAVLEPNEEPPLRPPTSKITYGQPKHEIQLYGGPRDGEVVDYKEARKYLGQGYGYIELPEKRITSAQPQPGESGQQPPHKPGEHWIQVPFGPDRGKWVRESEYAQKYGPLPQTQRQPITPPTTGVKTRLAQPTEPLPTPEKPEIISPYSREDQIIIDGWKKVEEQLPPGPKKSTAQNFLQKAQLQGKKNYEEKSGPVPVENLSIIKKMVGEFKDFYYQGYAKVVEKAKEKAGEQAWGAEYSQKQAIQYGMSSLIDLHRGLDLASWHFFFKILGPLGSVLENYHEHKIGWDMAYYGRAWWSPYRIDYLIKTLPEQKAFDITYDTLRNTIYYVNKIAGSPIFSKTATYDRFGRKVTKDFIVFTPLLKMQKGLNTVSILADNLSKRNTYQISLAFQKYQDAKKKFPKSSPEFKKAKDDWITFKNDNGDRIRNKLARFFGLRSVAKNIRETRRDPLSFLAILIGEWLFDIFETPEFRATIGSLAERLAASKLGVAAQEFFSGKYMTAGKMVGSGLVDAGRAVFSVNTLGGGLIGYQIGGVPGAILGSGGGWFWQVVRNFGLDTTRMAWTQRYLDFLKDEKYFGGKFTTREFILGPKLELQPTWVKFFNIKFNIAGRSWYPFRGMLTPGPISRFANWLNTGELKIGGFKIPIGQLVKPIPSVFINGTLIRWYVSPVLTQLGIQLGWSPQLIGIINSPVFQYGIPALWEYRPLIGNLWGNFLQRFLYTGESFGFLPGEYQFVRMGGGPGVGYIFNKAGTYVVFENEGGTAFQAAKTTGFYKN
ncbi:MAG: hypothetical protein M1120_02520, partial [Patescibacteria group bacterium]|nr:hypothetical protein [Patescibacteria group bacterium]